MLTQEEINEIAFKHYYVNGTELNDIKRAIEEAIELIDKKIKDKS